MKSCIQNFLEENYEFLIRVSNTYVGKKNGGDLLNDICIKLLEEGEVLDKLCERGEILKYVCRILSISSFSRTSPYYKKYKLFGDKQQAIDIERMVHEVENEYLRPTEIEIEKRLERATGLLKNIEWFDREVFKAYYLHSHSLSTLENATGIPRKTLYRSIRKAQAQIKSQIEA